MKFQPRRPVVFRSTAAPWQVRGLIALFAVAALAGAVVMKPSVAASPDAWASLKQRIAKRAQVDLFDDFSSGLDAWEDGNHGASTWSYDNNGFVNPGALSLLARSRGLTDYDVDGLIQIEAKGIGLAVRASGARNYQAARLLVDNSGRVPGLLLEHYAVLDGKASKPVRVRYPGRYQPDQLYRVSLRVEGDSFTLYLQGQLVDYWSDARLKTGGVGLFCANGELARVAWIRVAHNSDAMGRLCGTLVSLF
ncbi:MAG TPA: hypothetical protein VMB25_05405 [Bryobacteraceae bacterium]|nr:hypothetical protein [Bryobacteraceae bacterium]